MLRFILALIAVLLLGLAVLPPLVARGIYNNNPEMALTLFPGYSNAFIAQQFLEADTDYPFLVSSKAGKTASEKLLARAPLRIEPLLYNAIADHFGDRVDSAKSHFQRIQDLRPRNRVAAKGLHDIALAQGDSENALDQLDLLFRLDGNHNEYMLAAIALMRTSSGRQAVAVRLQKNPRWASQFIKLLMIYYSNDTEYIFERIQDYSRHKNHDAELIQQQFLSALIDQGRVSEAHSYWTRFLPPDTPMLSYIFDNSFDGISRSGPFSWSFNASKAGLAELTGDGALYVNYAGKEDTNLARQTLYLTSDTQLNLTTRFTGTLTPRQGTIQWRLICNEGRRQELARVALVSGKEAQGTTSAPFVIPDDDCYSQSILLEGRAGEYPQRASITIFDVDIKSASKY